MRPTIFVPALTAIWLFSSGLLAQEAAEKALGSAFLLEESGKALEAHARYVEAEALAKASADLRAKARIAQARCLIVLGRTDEASKVLAATDAASGSTEVQELHRSAKARLEGAQSGAPSPTDDALKALVAELTMKGNTSALSDLGPAAIPFLVQIIEETSQQQGEFSRAPINALAQMPGDAPKEALVGLLRRRRLALPAMIFEAFRLPVSPNTHMSRSTIDQGFEPLFVLGLKDRDAAVRSAAATPAGRIRLPFATLKAALLDADPRVRKSVANGLADRLGDEGGTLLPREQILELIQIMARDSMVDVRLGLLHRSFQLRAFDAEMVSRLLLDFTRDSSESIRAQALRTLREVVSPEVRPTLLAALKDPSPTVRSSALGTLNQILPAEIPLILPLFRDGDRSVRAQAVGHLTRIGSELKIRGPEDESDFLHLLSDPDSNSRQLAARVLAAHGSKECAASLLRLGSQKDAGVAAHLAYFMIKHDLRSDFVRALPLLDQGQIATNSGSLDQVNPPREGFSSRTSPRDLVRWIGDGNSDGEFYRVFDVLDTLSTDVAHELARVINGRKNPEDLTRLFPALLSMSETKNTEILLFGTQERVAGSPAGLAFLRSGLKHANPKFRETSAEVLQRNLDASTVSTLIEALSSEKDETVASTFLGVIASGVRLEHLPALRSALGTASEARVQGIFRALTKLSGAEIDGVLVEMLDSHPLLRQEIIFALARRKVEAGYQRTCELLASGELNAQDQIRSAAIASLGRYGQKDAAEKLMGFLKSHPHDQTRAQGLSRIHKTQHGRNSMDLKVHPSLLGLYALNKGGFPSVVRMLLTGDFQPSHVAEAVSMLAYQSGEDVVDVLRQALQHSEAEVRTEAVRAVGEGLFVELLPEVRAALRTWDSQVRAAAEDALERIVSLAGASR